MDPGAVSAPAPPPQRRRQPWPTLPVALSIALPVGLLLAGCTATAPLDLLQREVLHVVMVPSPQLEWLERPGTPPEVWRRMQHTFSELHPDIHLRVSVVPEAALRQELALRHQRGLGPDLLLLRAPVAISLLDHGLIDPVPASASLRQALSTVEPSNVARATRHGRLSGMPVYEEASLACFDRRRLQQPPTDIGQLLAVAAAGSPIGLAVDPPSLWWSAGSLGADTAMAPIITGSLAGQTAASRRADRSAIKAWLQWLRTASLQTRVDLAAGSQDLVQGLESGRLAWIPCFSPELPHLERALGPRLGVAPLPNGPAGAASPFTSLRVWGFGRDSSPRQRRIAKDLAALSLNPVLQRSLSLTSRSLLPANRYVPLPVASSGQLAALASAQDQFRSGSPLLSAPFSADRVNRVLPTILDTITEVMVGAISPEAGTDALMRQREVR